MKFSTLLLVGGLAACVVAPSAFASTVTYQWVNQSGPTDSGTMTFTLSSGTPGDFTGATLSAFTFTFQGGTMATLGSDGVSVTSLASPGWSAGTNGSSSTGFLTSVAEITNSGAVSQPPIFTFQFQPYSGESTGVDQAQMGTMQSFGYWQEQVSPAPLPGALLLLASGLGAFGFLGHRRRS